MEAKDWIQHPYDNCKGQKEKKVSRILYLDNEKKPKYKFKETISFLKKQLSNRKAICIGVNPAKAEEKIDVTNKRLISLLWDNVDSNT